ncbi:MAG: PAS domain-containing protein, partial [Bacillota bacterium]
MLMRCSDTTQSTRYRSGWKSVLLSTDVGRYGTAVGLVAAAFLGRLFLRPVLGATSPYLTSYLAVMTAAIWCGVGPALAATFLSALIGDLFFLNPFGYPASAELIHVGVMLLSNVGIAIVGGMARSSRRKAEQEAGSARRADEALRESEERFRALVEAISQIVWTTDEHGAVCEDSPSWRAFTGRSLQEWLGGGWADAVHPEDRDHIVAHWRDCVAAKVPCETEYRLWHHSGEYRWVQSRAVPQLHRDGTLKGWVGMSTDITRHKRAEASLAEARRKLDAALIAGEVGTFEWDVATDRLRPDHNFARMFGINLDSSGAAPMAEFIHALHPDDRHRVMERIRHTMDTGCDYQAEYRVITADRIRWITGRGKVERDVTGQA